PRNRREAGLQPPLESTPRPASQRPKDWPARSSVGQGRGDALCFRRIPRGVHLVNSPRAGMQQGSTSSHGCARSFYFAQKLRSYCRPSPEAPLTPRPSRAHEGHNQAHEIQPDQATNEQEDQARGPQPRGILGGSPQGPREREARGKSQNNRQRASEKPAGPQGGHHDRHQRTGTAGNHLPVGIGATHWQAQLVRGPAEQKNPDHEPDKEGPRPSAHRSKQLPPIATRYHVLPVLLLTALHKPGREQLQAEGKWPDNDVHQQ